MHTIQRIIEASENTRAKLSSLVDTPVESRPEDYKSQVASLTENLKGYAQEIEAMKAADLVGEAAAQYAASKAHIEDSANFKAAGAKGKGQESFAQFKSARKWLDAKGQGEMETDISAISAMRGKAISRADSAIAPGYEDLEPLDIRPARLLDFLPMEQSSASALAFRAQTTKLDAAAARSEGNALPQASFAAEAVTIAWSAVGHTFDVTREELEDDLQFANLIGVQAPAGVIRQLDADALTGSGTGPVMRGILNVPGLQTQAKSTDSRMLAIKKAMTKIRVNALTTPNLISLHPNDWDEIIGDLISGSVNSVINFQAGLNPRLWGLPVVENEVHTEGTGLVLDTSFWPLVMRENLMLESTIADGVKFGSLIGSYRAYVRAALKYRRATAGCTVTGI